MTQTIGVEVARYSERDVLGEALGKRGYKATPVEERGGRLGFDVECDGEDGIAPAELLHELELLVGELELPFIPIRGDGFVALRPPGD